MMENIKRKNLYLVTLSVSVAMGTLGVLSAWSSPVAAKIFNNEVNFDIDDEYVMYKVIAVMPIGSAMGSLITAYISDRFGRRVSILASALPIAIGSLVVVFAQNAWLLYITSIAWSCGKGMIITVINYYLSELADKDVRGTLSVITSFMLQIGVILTFAVGPYLSYMTLNIITLVLPFLFFGTCWWIPETPYYYLKSGNVEAARRSLRTLRGYRNENILEDELLALKASVNNEMSQPSTVKEFFVRSRHRMAIVIAVVLKVTQMMTSPNVVGLYFSWIVEETIIGFLKIKSPLVFIIFTAVSIVAGMIAMVLVDRVGRRPLLVLSYIATGACFITVAVYFFIKDVLHIDQDLAFSFIPILSIIFANIFSSVGYNALIVIIPAEIFPMNVKAIAMTSLHIFTLVLSFAAVNIYMLVKFYCVYSNTLLFVMFGGFAFSGSILSYFLVIETRGKDLRDIQVELQGDINRAVDVANDENDECTEMKELATEHLNHN